MAKITFDVSSEIIQELNAIAVEAGFPNAKTMCIAYLKAEIKAHRDNLARKAIVEANTDDVVIV